MNRLAAPAFLTAIASAIIGALAPMPAAPPPAPEFRDRIAIVPANARVFAGGQMRFHLSSSLSPSGPAMWSVIGPGRIDGNGTFVAPPDPGAIAQVVAAGEGRAAAASVRVVSAPPVRSALAVISCYDDGVADVRDARAFASIGTESTGARSSGVASDAGRRIAFVAAESRLEAIDMRSATVTASAPVPGTRFSEVASLSGGYIAVTDNDASSGAPGVRIFRLGDRGVPALVASIAAGDTPEGIAVDGDGRTFYVSNVNSDDVMRFLFDARSGTARRTGRVKTGHRPFGIAVDAVRRRLFVADNDTPTVSGTASQPGLEVFALPSMHRIARVATGSPDALPLGVAADSAANRLFVTNEGDGDVAAYSIAPFRLVGKAPAGRTPWLPAIDVHRGELFVPSALGDSFSVFDVRSLRTAAFELPTCGYPTSIAIFD